MQSAPKLVIVHPIVLLSVVDHFNRVVKDNRSKRVVGALVGNFSFFPSSSLINYFLGTYNKKTGAVDVANSFAVPFEEDPREPHVWFLDHLYLEAMFGMVRRVKQTNFLIKLFNLRLMLEKKLLDGIQLEIDSNNTISKFMRF